MKRIAVVGAMGYVGKAIRNVFGKHFGLALVDPAIKRDMGEQRQSANECDLAVICVPTPMKEGGEVDISIVEEAVVWIETPLILIKSTIPPGTVDFLKEKYGKRIVFSPEYIGQGLYTVPWWKDKGYPHPTDISYHDFQIFGGDRTDTREVLEYFKRVLGPDCKYIQTDSTTAELCKYFENAWGATKVTFCNEFAKIAGAFGVDYDELRELWLLDGRVERMHTAVFKESRGFGGKCYPKDVNGIVKASESKGYIPKLLKTVLEVNNDLHKQ